MVKICNWDLYLRSSDIVSHETTNKESKKSVSVYRRLISWNMFCAKINSKKNQKKHMIERPRFSINFSIAKGVCWVNTKVIFWDSRHTCPNNTTQFRLSTIVDRFFVGLEPKARKKNLRIFKSSLLGRKDEKEGANREVLKKSSSRKNYFSLRHPTSIWWLFSRTIDNFTQI